MPEIIEKYKDFLEFEVQNIPQDNLELSIVMPCLNEAETVSRCIWKARTFLREHNIRGEVVIADNGSTDGSQLLALKAGARVVSVEEKGYGSALSGGINFAKGKYIIMGDSDDSYDFLSLLPMLEKLRSGNDLVMGNRFKAKLVKGAMPWSHRYIGNPFLTFVGRLLFKSKVGDFHCGLRGFSKEAFEKLDLRTTGMEFASEMVVKATLFKLNISEVPIVLSPDGRSGKPHLRSFRDGWRHLQFLFIYSPRWLFLYPGMIMMLFGLAIAAWILPRPFSTTPDVHSMLYAVAGIMIGFQAVIFAIFSKTFAVHEKLIPAGPIIERFFNKFTPNKGIIAGLILIALGIAGSLYTYYLWTKGTFFEVGISVTLRYVIASFTLLVMGFQLIFSSFFYGLLILQNK